MSGREHSDESSKRKVAYIYSPEYIETCDTLSKVPNRVRWIQLAAFGFFLIHIHIMQTVWV